MGSIFVFYILCHLQPWLWLSTKVLVRTNLKGAEGCVFWECICEGGMGIDGCRWLKDCLWRWMWDKLNGPSSLPTRLWDALWKEPTNPIKGSSKPCKACRRCIKGNCSAVVGEVSEAVSQVFAFIDAYIVILAWRFGFWKHIKNMFYVCVTLWLIQCASYIAVGTQTIQTVVNVNPEHAYYILLAHRDVHTHTAPYVGTAAGTEPWGQHVCPAGNLMLPEEKRLYSCVYGRIFVFTFQCRCNLRSRIGSISNVFFFFLSACSHQDLKKSILGQAACYANNNIVRILDRFLQISSYFQSSWERLV